MIYLAGVCLVATFFAAASCGAEDVVKDAPAPSGENAVSVAMKTDDFVYQLEGRPDPFEPFIKPKVATTLEREEVTEEEVVLTGMQLFEPGQLKLVAVMFAENNKIAMVEDVTGKGYVINEGVLIGRYGVVSQITPDRVIITETARNRTGKEVTTTVVMRLNE
jgi:type IV pilus assembly protein PilP